MSTHPGQPAIHAYVCSVCGGEFVDEDPDRALDEAAAAFSPAELRNTAIVCDSCWREMREAMPDLDVRYGPGDPTPCEPDKPWPSWSQ